MSAAILALQAAERELLTELDAPDAGRRVLLYLRFAALDERGRVVMALGGVTPDRREELSDEQRRTFAQELRRAADVTDPPGGWAYLLELVQALIDRHYPADLFGGGGPFATDPGARFVTRLRDAIAELELASDEP